MTWKAVLFLVLLTMSGASAAAATAAVQPPVMPPPQRGEPAGRKQPGPPAVQRVAPGIFRIGSLLLNKAERSVTFPAEVNMDRGLLEYLLVRNGGKTHESLLRTAVEPTELQMALLLLGLEGAARPLPTQGSSEIPTGDPVTVTLALTGSDGRESKWSPEQWVVKKRDDAEQVEPPLKLVFTGSVISSGMFAAQAEGSMIAIYRDPAAIIDNTSGDGDSDKIWFVREGVVPAAGTPVTVVVTASGAK